MARTKDVAQKYTGRKGTACEELNLIQQNIEVRSTKVVNTRLQDWIEKGKGERDGREVGSLNITGEQLVMQAAVAPGVANVS